MGKYSLGGTTYGNAEAASTKAIHASLRSSSRVAGRVSSCGLWTVFQVRIRMGRVVKWKEGRSNWEETRSVLRGDCFQKAGKGCLLPELAWRMKTRAQFLWEMALERRVEKRQWGIGSTYAHKTMPRSGSRNRSRGEA